MDAIKVFTRKYYPEDALLHDKYNDWNKSSINRRTVTVYGKKIEWENRPRRPAEETALEIEFSNEERRQIFQSWNKNIQQLKFLLII